MVEIAELGTDINSSWTLKNGDLEIVSNEQNLVQATSNRLNTTLDSLSDFYGNYGSIIHRFLGWKANDVTLKFLQIELVDCLKQDPRYENFDINLAYTETNEIDINITVYFDDESEFEMNYVLGTDGVVEEY